MPSLAKRPYSASLLIAFALLGRALRMAIRRWQFSALSLLVFLTVVGPVFIANSLLSPDGAAQLASQILLMATGYVALIAALIVMIYLESISAGATQAACQQRLRERWPGIRSEIIKTLALGVASISFVKFGLYSLDSDLPGQARQNEPLIFYPVMGAALFAWFSHLHGCIHSCQLQLIARTRMCSRERASLAKLASQRYDNPVSLLLLLPAIGATVVATRLPVATPLLWLLTFWYLEVSLHQLWLANPKKERG